eukprot:CAMPEP_0194176928 /NCGR_PEP_ID=MMETSP0154-20130528/10794_1 /TAXON_ID=1049557 /ORGANISM="Thalassiothrix antarctica, Strain L6-D1" /LENGTH=92 /DNA_ID=CAMNT_0038891319 /DNA_START=46 /DNA_END=324 /DNA_ORIENTATION=+
MCNITGLPKGVGNKDEELKSFFLDQIKRIHSFVRKFPSHRLVTVAIDSPNAGGTLQDAFGIDKRCWGHYNKRVSVKRHRNGTLDRPSVGVSV